jgi:hypothetical protein
MRLAILCCYQVSACLNLFRSLSRTCQVPHTTIQECIIEVLEGVGLRLGFSSWLRLKSDPLPFCDYAAMRLCGLFV